MGFTPYVNTIMLSPGSDMTLDGVEAILRRDYAANNPDDAEVVRDGDRLSVELGDWCLTLHYSQGGTSVIRWEGEPL